MENKPKEKGEMEGEQLSIRRFQGVRFKKYPSPEAFRGFKHIILVFTGEEYVFGADVARIVTSDEPDECTSLLEIEYLPRCVFSCTYCNPVNRVTEREF